MDTQKFPQLLPASAQEHDGAVAGRKVQGKTTQGQRSAISSEPEHLLALKLNRDDTFTEQHNKPGDAVWALFCDKLRTMNGQYQVALSPVRSLTKSVHADPRLTPVRMAANLE